MNADAPRCRRCQGARFVHVLRVRDSYQVGDFESSVTAWADRPVRTTSVNAVLRCVGHFEIWVCRGCGLTEWIARAWEPDGVALRPSPCEGCATTTPHASLVSLDQVNEHEYAETRLTRGILGGEGTMEMSICSRCDGVKWRALDYALLDGKFGVRYRRAHEPQRRCLRCHDDACLIEDSALEAQSSEPIALGPKPRGLLQRLFNLHPTFGRFLLRVCLPCGALEWYGHDLDAVIPSATIALVGDTPQMATLGGPYR